MAIVELFLNPETDPIPVAIKIDNLVQGLRISGVVPETGAVPGGLEAQVAQSLENIRNTVEAAGGSTDNIAQVSFFFATFSASIMREVVNPLWEKMFTDANERPTYKFMPAPNLPAGREVHCEFWAVLGEKRRSIQIPGVSHTNPIPFGVRMGRYLFSSRCLPADPATGRNPEGMERQLECSLGNASTLLDLAGMKWPDVSGGRAFVSNLDYVPAVTAAWNARFDGSKPAPLRPVLYGAGGNAHVYVEFIAEAGG